jgi:hypothetical protein
MSHPQIHCDPNTLFHPFDCRSADYSQPHSETFGSVLRRISLSTFLGGVNHGGEQCGLYADKINIEKLFTFSDFHEEGRGVWGDDS